MQIYQLQLGYRFSGKCTLPKHKTSMFRGMFGNVFRQKVCQNLKESNCAKCPLATQCEYAKHFHNLNLHPENVEEKYRKYRNFPAKYVFFVPSSENYWKEGETITVLLSFFGMPQIEMPFLIQLLMLVENQRIDRRSPAIMRLQFIKDSGSGHLLFQRSQTNPTELKPIEWIDFSAKTAVLDFRTPCRIINQDSRVSTELNGNILGRRMQERLKLLGIGCEPYQPKWFVDELKVLEKEIHWQDVGHRSNRQKQRLKLGGFVGKVKIRCENQAFWRDLQVLEHMHLGSNTQSGYGKFQILQ